MLLKCFDCAISQLESSKLHVSGSKLELLAVEYHTLASYCAEEVGDICPSLLHVVQPDERVIDHFDVPVDVASYLVIAVCISITTGQLSLRRHLVSVPAPGSYKREVMVVVRVNRYTMEPIPGFHGGHQPAGTLLARLKWVPPM